MKKLVFLIKVAAALFLFNSCAVGYVETEPTYVAVAQPVSPGPSYIWIEGNWVWSSSSRTYYHTDGYWVQPRKGRTYVQGHWSRGPKGYYWNKGRWK